jgi:hypothetical protein
MIDLATTSACGDEPPFPVLKFVRVVLLLVKNAFLHPA